MENKLYELEIAAEIEKLPEVLSFIERHLEEADCPPKAQMQLAIAAEEIFVNIAHYAYAPETGDATVRVEVSSSEPVTVAITPAGQAGPGRDALCGGPGDRGSGDLYDEKEHGRRAV